MRNELGKKMRKLREERGYTPKYLAGKIGVSESAYRSYENGSRKPDADKINCSSWLDKQSTGYGRFSNANRPDC